MAQVVSLDKTDKICKIVCANKPNKVLTPEDKLERLKRIYVCF